MKKIMSILAISTVLGLGAYSGFAADNVAANAHAGHDMKHDTPLPTEGGQAAFTTIAEIVDLLYQDPNTDWSKVDINRLREHLVDMNELTMNAQVKQSFSADAATFTISGAARTLQAVKSMVPAHSIELNKMGGWQVDVEVKTDKVIMQISSSDELLMSQVKALGFFGMMATGAHHQAHHWGMATGNLMGH